MAQFIGNSQFQSSNSDSNVMEEAILLTETGSNSSGKEATRQDSSIVRILQQNTVHSSHSGSYESQEHKKILCYLKTPSLSSCKQIREAMNAFIEKENIRFGASRDNSLCDRGETCLETGATENFWESIGSG